MYFFTKRAMCFKQVYFKPSWSTLMFLVFVSLLVNSSASSQYERENWVNPDDMLNYDRATKTMNVENRSGKMDVDKNKDTNNFKQNEYSKVLQEKLANCELTLETMEKSRPKPVKVSRSETEPKEANHQSQRRKCGNEVAADRQYMKRFVNILLKVSGLVDFKLGVGQTKQSSIWIDVNADHLMTLQQFASSTTSVSLIELDEVLSHVLHAPESEFLVPLDWFERLSRVFSSVNGLYRLVPYCVTLLLLSMLVLRRTIAEISATFIVLVFTMSFQWTYDYMLKEAEIKQYIALKKHNDVPDSCRPSFSLSGYFKYWFMHDPEECKEYYTAQLMDPALQVSPTIVLSELLSSMLLHPAGKLGESIAKFCGSILGGLPMIQNWIVLLLVFLFFTVAFAMAVVLLCGGRLRFPYFLGGLELTGQSPYRILEQPQSQRAAVQEINPAPTSTGANTTAPTNNIVSALSSHSEGLVFMNVPSLERLMSIREDRVAQRDCVERLMPAETSVRPDLNVCGSDGRNTTGCKQCKGTEQRSSTAEGNESFGENREQKASRRVAAIKTEARVDPRAAGDSVTNVFNNQSRAVVLQKSKTISESINEAPRHLPGRSECILDETFVVESLGEIPREVVLNRSLVLSGDGSTEVGSGALSEMEKSTFIDEIRKLLEEDDFENFKIGDRLTTESTRDEVEGARSEGRLDLNLLRECSSEGNAYRGEDSPTTQEVGSGSQTGAGASKSTVELIRKASSDSSEGSGDFVKL